MIGGGDAFDLLGLPRRAWLDAEVVRSAFRGRAAVLHPDAAAGDAEAFRLLAEAARVVSDTPTRLNLLAQGGQSSGPAVVPADLAGLFGGAAEVMHEAAEWKTRQAAARSALARAMAKRDALLLDEKLEAVSARIEEQVSALEQGCRDLDAVGAEAGPDAGMSAALAIRAAFLWKWRDRVQRARLALVMEG